MTIKVTLGRREIKSRIASFLLTLLTGLIFLAILIVVVFLVLPLLWFVVVSVFLAALVLSLFAPRLVSSWRVIVVDRRRLEPKR